MKLILEHHGVTHTISSDDDQADIIEVMEQFRGLLVSAGYHPHSVDECFNIGTWFTEREVESPDEDLDELIEEAIDKGTYNTKMADGAWAKGWPEK